MSAAPRTPSAPGALAAMVGQLAGARVVCVGDVMLDRFIYGEVDRISPEAPIPVCRITDEVTMLGGAGNVVRNLVALGAAASFLTVSGEDADGRTIAAMLDALPGVDAGLLTDPERETTTKTRYFAASQQLLRADRESVSAIGPALEDEILRRAVTALADAGALVLSDYGKGVLTDGLIAKLIGAARAAGVPVIVDPKGTDFSRYGGADIVTPNRAELAAASGMETRLDEQVESAARTVIGAAGIAAMVATRGASGMTVISADGTLHLKAEAREVFDVSGAGDTVVAALAAARAAGLGLADAAALANSAAGIVVGKQGTAVAYAADLMSALREGDLKRGERKSVGLDEALARIAAWRRAGNRIGFTNGCFDLIHPGHVSLLDQAKAACDRLVVGLNSDDSVKRLKGESRPVQGEAARAAVLGSLASVDLVVIFSEDTPLSLIEAIRPDVLVKGADYSEDQVVGADIVRAQGGKVLLAELTPGQSTTATIARMGK